MELIIQPLEKSELEVVIEDSSPRKEKSEKDLQRTENWHEERRGNWTASQFKNLMTCDSSGGKLDWFNQEKVFKFSDGAVKYMFANAMERKTGRYLITDSTKEMKYGTKVEPLIFKRAGIELAKLGLTMKEVGFKTFPNISTAGVSSDSIVLNEKGETVASFESKACSSWVTLYDRTYEQVNEKSQDFWQTQGQMLAWEVEENYYCVISPPKDINVYLYCENIMDLYETWCDETEMHIEIIKKSPIHLAALEKRILIAESTVGRFLEQDTDETLKEILHEEIDYFRNSWLEDTVSDETVAKALKSIENEVEAVAETDFVELERGEVVETKEENFFDDLESAPKTNIFAKKNAERKAEQEKVPDIIEPDMNDLPF